MKKISVSLLLIATLSPAAAQEAKTPFQKVFDVMSSPQILHKSFRQILRDLNGLCKKSTKSEAEQTKNGNVECSPDVGIESFFIDGETANEIFKTELEFHGDDKGAYAKAVLMKNFGTHPELKLGELNWSPKKRRKDDPQSYAKFGPVKDKFFLEIGNETDTGDGEG